MVEEDNQLNFSTDWIWGVGDRSVSSDSKIWGLGGWELPLTDGRKFGRKQSLVFRLAKFEEPVV